MDVISIIKLCIVTTNKSNIVVCANPSTLPVTVTVPLDATPVVTALAVWKAFAVHQL